MALTVDTALLEAALERRPGPLRFEPVLEAAYQRATGPARITRIAACNVAGAFSFFVLSAQTAVHVATVEPLMGPLRGGTISFIVLAAAIAYLLRRSIPAWVVETLTSLGALPVLAYTLTFAYDPPADPGMVIQTGALFTLILHIGLFARQQFRFALGTGLLIFVAYLLSARSYDAVQALIVRGNVLLFGTTLAFTLLANYVLEHRERRAWLLQSLEAHRLRALQAGAEALQRLAHSDALTGLANRRRLDAALSAAWQAAAGEPLAVLQIDVDFFKRYNDRYGHPAGDLCLQRVAEVLASAADRHGGLAARTGGEEFALLLPRCTAEAAAGIGEGVVAAVRALALAHAGSAVAPVVTVSVGSAVAVPGEAQRAADLLRAGDDALYEAKRTGRNRIVCSTGLPPAAPAAMADLPAGEPAEAATSPPSPLLQHIDTLTATLRHGLRRLRFPAPLEAAYLARVSPLRQRLLPVLGVTGLLILLGYIWLSRPVLGGVADLTMNLSLALSAATLPLLAWCGRPMGYLRRETIFSIVALIAGWGVVFALSFSQDILVFSFLLALFLVPMFCAIVAAQPFRHSLATSVLVVGFGVVMLHPGRGDWTAVWAEANTTVVIGALYSLLGCYLIERSARRQYLLGQIGEAQRQLITENAERLRRLANADPLTGIANRRRFDTVHAGLTQACAAEGRPLGLLLIDIDHFKRYNDSHGHITGDACLKRVADALCEPVDGADPPAERRRLARIGGEEFALLLPGADAAQALAVATLLCERVRRLAIAHADSPLGPNVTVSIGAASVAPVPGAESGAPGLLLKQADLALYRAKTQGRDRASV